MTSASNVGTAAATLNLSAGSTMARPLATRGAFSMDTLIEKGEALYARFLTLANLLPHPILAILRGYWGWQFFQTGKGKLGDLASVTEFFTSLGIPFPKFNAIMAGGTECFGGLLLLVGLGSRLISVPLAVTMMVAYATASRDALLGIFSDPSNFIAQDPFMFLLVSLLVLSFGPGAFSLDTLVKRFLEKRREA